jgi:hypothetical protein
MVKKMTPKRKEKRKFEQLDLFTVMVKSTLWLLRAPGKRFTGSGSKTAPAVFELARKAA